MNSIVYVGMDVHKEQCTLCWENGDTVPNTDTLKLLSKEFDVSINTLLGNQES